MNITIPYYEDNTRISNSAIGWFLKHGPLYLYKKLSGLIPDEKNSTLERGTMIHEYLLQPEIFDTHYTLWSKAKPASEQQRTFCQAIVESTEIEPNKAVLEAYKKAYSTAGKTEDKILSESLKLAFKLRDYIAFIKENKKTIITDYDMYMLQKIKENIKKHEAAKNIITTVGKHDNVETFHEFHINWQWENVNCKSLLDIIQFDYDKKVCTISDLKTTSKLYKFEESIKTYDYLRQLCYYKLAAEWYIENELKQEPLYWDFNFNIVAIDTQTDFSVRVFNIPWRFIHTRSDCIWNSLGKISWHIENNLWEHSKEYYLNNGIETLNLEDE